MDNSLHFLSSHWCPRTAPDLQGQPARCLENARAATAPPSGLSRGEALPSHCESEGHSVVSNSLRRHGLYSPWGSPGQYWSGSPFPPPGELPNPGIEPKSPTLQVDSLPAASPAHEKLNTYNLYPNCHSHKRTLHTLSLTDFLLLKIQSCILKLHVFTILT